MDNLAALPSNTDAHTETPTPLLARREAFAVAFVELQSATQAYRATYDCAGMLPATVRQRAYELRHSGDVAARVRELYAEAAADTIVDTRSRMVRLQAIVESDPGELVRVCANACRHCHGRGGAYQWRDPDEFALACATELDAAVTERRAPKLPSDAGGYGFTVFADPNPACESCAGHGHTRVVVTPTDQLSPGARALLHSIKQKPSGEIEIRLLDRLAASDQLNRMAGVYVDRSLSLNVTATVPELRDMTRDEQLDLLESIKPTRPPAPAVSPAPVTIEGETA